MRTLAEELEECFEARNQNPQWTLPATAKRLVRRAETLAAVRDELRARVAKLEAVAKAAKPAAKALRFWLESDIMCECDGGIHTCGYTERVQELNELEQALAALEEE